MDRREHLAIDETEIERRFVICYTASRVIRELTTGKCSKRHIDREADVFEIFERIRDAGGANARCAPRQTTGCCSKNDARRYPNRKRLRRMITTPHMDNLVEMALANGAEAREVCAGWGGCIASFAPTGASKISNALWRQQAGKS